MPAFNIYNEVTGEDLGTYEGANADVALDVMARDFGFADYADCVREHGVTVADAKAELQITQAA